MSRPTLLTPPREIGTRTFWGSKITSYKRLIFRKVMWTKRCTNTKRPKIENPRVYVFQVVILVWSSAFHCGFQVLISGIFPFVWKQYKVFSIHFKTSLPVTFTSIACWQVQAGGIGMETFRWAGWRDEAKKSGGKRDWQSLYWTLLNYSQVCVYIRFS